MSDSNDRAEAGRSSSCQTGNSSATLKAYQRASAAYQRLEEISQRVDEMQPQVRAGENSDHWDERVAAYLALRREWNEAFREFDDAVNEYAAALWEERLSACAEHCGPRSED